MSDIIDLDARRPHYAGWCECQVCEHRWMGVMDARADLDSLECPNCGNMKGCLDEDERDRLTDMNGEEWRLERANLLQIIDDLNRTMRNDAELTASGETRGRMSRAEAQCVRLKAERDEYARALLWAHGYSVPGWPFFYDYCGHKSVNRYEWRFIIRERLQDAGISLEDSFRALVAEQGQDPA